MAKAAGVDSTTAFSVHSMAIKIPIQELTSDGSKPSNVMSSKSVIGVWASASRRKATIRHGDKVHESGGWVQVSRLGNPLINEAVIPMGQKDYWNTQPAQDESQFASHYLHPELAGLLPVLYPGVFPKLKNLTAARADLAAVLLTGIPAGVIPGFQNFTGARQADQLRLNVAIPPTSHPKPLGLVGGDPAGWPNGRRVFDDVTSVILRAVAGAIYPLVAPSYTPDAAAALLTDGLGANSVKYLSKFPYLGTPVSGYDTKPLAA
jgi:hypothetical protein